MNARNLLSLAGALLVLGAAGWYWGMGHAPAAPGETAERRPDYVITQLDSRETDDAGRPWRRFQSPEVRHYSQPQDEAEMDRPVVLLYADGKEAWQLTAPQGRAYGESGEVVFSGGVHAERRDPAAVPVTFDTASLHVFPREDRLYGKDKVKVDSPRGQLTSQGIEANLKTGDLVLNENVTGNYAPASR